MLVRFHSIIEANPLKYDFKYRYTCTYKLCKFEFISKKPHLYDNGGSISGLKCCSFLGVGTECASDGGSLTMQYFIIYYYFSFLGEVEYFQKIKGGHPIFPIVVRF